MKRGSYEAFLTEFPFLEEILKKERKAHPCLVDSIRVERVDQRLLYRILSVLRYSFVEYRETLWVVMPSNSVQKVPIWATIGPSVGRPVIEALVGFEEATHLVLLRQDSFSNQFRDTFAVIVYKAARGFTIKEEMNRAKEIALAEVRREADF